jgi:hypothetical protein
MIAKSYSVFQESDNNVVLIIYMGSKFLASGEAPEWISHPRMIRTGETLSAEKKIV